MQTTVPSALWTEFFNRFHILQRDPSHMPRDLADVFAMTRAAAITRQQADKLGDLPRINGEVSMPASTANTLVSDVGALSGLGDLFLEEGAEDTVELVSASSDDDVGGTGAEKVIVRGLDANFLLQDEEVEMDGTTPVTTSAEFVRVHEIAVSQAGAFLGNNVGAIMAQYSGGSNPIAQIAAGMGRSKCGHYTVPDNMVMALSGVDAWARYTGSTPDFRLQVSVFPWFMFGDDGSVLDPATAQRYGGAQDFFAGAGNGQISFGAGIPWILTRRSIVLVSAALASGVSGVTVFADLPAVCQQTTYPAYVAP